MGADQAGYYDGSGAYGAQGVGAYGVPPAAGAVQYGGGQVGNVGQGVAQTGQAQMGQQAAQTQGGYENAQVDAEAKARAEVAYKLQQARLAEQRQGPFQILYFLILEDSF